MKDLKEFGLITLLAAFYFTSVYFAVAALFPALALQLGFIVAALAMLGYLVLVLSRRDEGILMGLLITLPIICIAAGVAWWLLRLLGLWVVR